MFYLKLTIKKINEQKIIRINNAKIQTCQS